MSKTVIGIVVAVLVIAAGGWYYISGSRGNSMMMADSSQSERGTIKDLMSRTSTKCTVSNVTANSESSGVVYVGQGKMRGEFKTVTKSPDMTIESYMISDGEYMYSWSDAMPQGVKLPIASTQMSDQPNAPKSEQVEMYNAEVSYDCDSWSVDESQFEIPSSVTFVDMSSMLQGVGAGAGAGSGNEGSMNPPSKSAQCNMCDAAPEPQRTQCRAALQCR